MPRKNKENINTQKFHHNDKNHRIPKTKQKLAKAIK